MRFEKLVIHEVDWPHTNLIIISSSRYPELGILAYGEQKRGGEIKILLPGFIKGLEISKPCGCCAPHLIGSDDAWEDLELRQRLRRSFIAALRSCCKKNGVTTLIFQEFDGDELWMEQDVDGLHLVDPNSQPDEIDYTRFKIAFSEMRLNIPGFGPEDLKEY
ncbi:MAG: hypothetical protein P1P90_02300 [Patescibacteria group bacterium]|nr:hypothetical protein [Patescibacteria group bacterium]